MADYRAIVERCMGRSLQPGEVVHHINGNRDDNRIVNLMAFESQSDHMLYQCRPQLRRRLRAPAGSHKKFLIYRIPVVFYGPDYVRQLRRYMHALAERTKHDLGLAV